MSAPPALPGAASAAGNRRLARPVEPAGGLREVAYRAVCLLWFTLPWEGVIRLSGGTTIARVFGVVAAGAGLLAVLVSRPRYRPNDFIALCAAFAAWVILSMFWTQSPSWTVDRATTMAQLLLMVLLTWEFGHTPRRLRGLMAAWVAGCCVIAGIVLIAFALGEQATRYTAPGTHPGDLSFTLTLGIPLAWYLSLTTAHRGLLVLYRLFVPLAVLAIILTAARAAFLSLPIVLLLVPLTFRLTSRRARIAVAVTVAVGLIGITALSANLAGPLARLATTGSEIQSGTLDHRTELWAIALRLIEAHPVLGVGAGSSRVAVGAEFTQERGLQDTFLSVGAELGVIGLTLFLLICLTAAWRAIRHTAWLERRFALALTLVFLIGQVPRHADYEKSTWAILVLLALVGAVLPAGPSDGQRPPPSSGSWSPGPMREPVPVPPDPALSPS